MQDGIEAARGLGITEADASYDIDGWDSAAKAALLANVLMGARITPHDVDRRGIGRLTPERVRELASSRKTVCLVSRARVHPARNPGPRCALKSWMIPIRWPPSQAHPICCCSTPI